MKLQTDRIAGYIEHFIDMVNAGKHKDFNDPVSLYFVRECLQGTRDTDHMTDEAMRLMDAFLFWLEDHVPLCSREATRIRKHIEKCIWE